MSDPNTHGLYESNNESAPMACPVQMTAQPSLRAHCSFLLLCLFVVSRLLLLLFVCFLSLCLFVVSFFLLFVRLFVSCWCRPQFSWLLSLSYACFGLGLS
ncbi:unnamed protein product [Polarella glacialis]|uniref:Uncharacterized protein n=1 Tax=Polarella glacialis TaxID=89957 RepID=A0A813L280_POLGL|nr:unnamed protein product [Polarella glacialis]